jgi:hypothetical protein
MEQPRRDISDRLCEEELPLAVPSRAPQMAAMPIPDGYTIQGDLLPAIAVTREEVALLRAFLGTEIDAILFGQGPVQGEQ